MNKLIIVESPTKARTISKFLGDDFNIIATMGHLRDLPKSKFGVEIKPKNGGFEFFPEYIVDDKKKSAVKDLEKNVKKAKVVLLATDPDREGEAIAWHITEILNLKSKVSNLKLARVVFHEITKTAIDKAIDNPRKVDTNLVNAQQGRRILDRLVGYSLSPLLWKKVRGGLSAGRVQSVAVRLVIEREREIEKFKSEPYFRIWAAFEKESKDFVAELIKINQESIELSETLKLFDGKYKTAKTIFDNLNKTETVVSDIDNKFKIINHTSKIVLRRPFPPFTTSTLQQDAARRFGWSSKQTMRIAQSLFEKGHITYHRTDSYALAPQAINEIAKFIGENYGNQYLPEKPIFYKTKSKNAQEAHEAIRPTDVKLKIKNSKLKIDDKKEEKLYELIWQRAIACQMAPAKVAQTRVELTLSLGNNCHPELVSGSKKMLKQIQHDENKYLFVANGSHVIFDGFARIYPVKFSENDLPPLKDGETISSESFGVTDHSTQPPPRYNEATLIGALEKNGIGRPSTYAPIISTIQMRLYVEKKEGKFYPTAIGVATNDFLVEHFKNIVDLPFTATMEDKLDDIAGGVKKWQPVLSNFWRPFSKEVKKTEKTAKRVKVPVEKTGEKCPECKEGELVIRTGRFGKFIACSRFPDCRYKANYNEKANFVCPTCGSEAVIKSTRKGRKFFSCIAWPKCKWSSWKKPKN